MVTTPTFQVGYSRQNQYQSGAARPRRHIVEKNDSDEWRLLCTGSAGTREYKGFIGAVTCRDCKAKVGAAVDEHEEDTDDDLAM